ncbi:MAG: hypothetical protein IJB78_04570, partial [Oscillospiraceae bacterium]|nr:hypothetical protein [Oscillospiraceae bacterium]
GSFINLGRFGNYGTYENLGSETNTGDTNMMVYSYEELKAALDYFVDAGGSNNTLDICEDITIEEDITLGENIILNLNGYDLTVPAGLTLTNNGVICIDAHYINEAWIFVEEGARLVNNGVIDCINIENNGDFDGRGSARVNIVDDVSVSGVPGWQIDALLGFNDAYQLADRLYTSSDYAEAEIYYNGLEPTEIIIEEDLWISANTILSLDGVGTLRVKAGTELSNYGVISIHEPDVLIIEEGASFNNEGLLYMDEGCIVIEGGEAPAANMALAWTADELKAALADKSIEGIYIVDNIVFNANLLLEGGRTIKILEYGSLEIGSKYTLTNNGAIDVSGQLNIKGKFAGNRVGVLFGGGVEGPEGCYFTYGQLVEEIVFDPANYAVIDNELPLKFTVLPLDAEDLEVDVWSESDMVNVDYGYDGITVYGYEEGTAPIVAESCDGGARAEFELPVIDYRVSVSINGELYEEDQVIHLTSNDSIKLTADFLPGNLSGAGIVYRVEPEYADFISISAKGSTATLKTGYVSARTSAEFVVSAADGIAAEIRVLVEIDPDVQSIVIPEAQNGTYIYDLNAPDSSMSMQLEPVVYPMGYDYELSYSGNNPKVADVDDNGLITFTGVAGTVKVTVAATDGSGKKATITINAKKCTQNIRIEGAAEVMSGKSFTYKAYDDDTEASLGKGKVLWSVTDGADSRVSIN